MKVIIPEKIADVIEEYDVAVIGGGPAGIGAAVAAARNGSKVVLVEKRGFLGGNITACYVETTNGVMHNTMFKPSGLYEEIEVKYREEYGDSHDIRADYKPHRFNSEYFKVFLDQMLLNEGVKIKFHAFVNDVIIENDKISAVIIQGKKGVQAIKAKIVIDSTGDGDVAFSAGIPFDQGRKSDNLCQPGTINFGVAGVNSKRINEYDKGLHTIADNYVTEHKAGRTGISNKRQYPCFGRLTEGGQISYINYCDIYRLDPTDIDDLTKGEIEGRQHVMEIYKYFKNNVEGMEKIEVCRIAPEIGFRDSRRIKGFYSLTMEDIEQGRKFDDVITVFPRFYDMLALDGNWDGGRDFGSAALYKPVEGDRSYDIPYRCLVPLKIKNMLVAGRCISCDHAAESSIREVSACMMTGQAAGTAAAIAVSEDLEPGSIDVKMLQKRLTEQGVDLNR